MNTPNITVTLSEFGLDTAEGVAVQLTPTAVLAPVDPASLRASTNSSGIATFSSIPPGFYTLTIAANPSVTIRIPDQAETVVASDVVLTAAQDIILSPLYDIRTGELFVMNGGTRVSILT